MDDQMDHHFSAYGFFSPAIEDYVDLNIMPRLASAGGVNLRRIVDPYEYRDRFKNLPKLMINATGDEFFLPDSSQFYFDDLPGEKHLRYVPNANHGLGGSDAIETLLIYHQSVLLKLPRPKFTWEVLPNGTIRVETADTPAQVNLWQATNPIVRIFVNGFGASPWTPTPLTDQGGGVYLGSVSIPATGWTAYMVELIFDSGTPVPYKFTTEVHVLPEFLPFAKVADNDEDGDVDGVDFLVFAACYNGANNPPRSLACPPTAKDLFDYDDDNDVDIVDFATFARCYNGAGKPPRLCSIP
jgi:PhoPQ-activated pathogenicity-related protein